MADKDTILGRPKVQSAVGGALPIEDPGAQSLDAQRAELMRQIAELESTLQYMGTAHPQQATLMAKLDQLRMMVERMDGAVAQT